MCLRCGNPFAEHGEGGKSGADDGGSFGYLNGDDRGGFGSNGKPSLDVGEAAAQITRGDLHWGGGALGRAATVTYAFRESAPGTMPDDTSGFSQFTAAQVAAAEKALQAWSDVANITFARVSGANGYSNDASILFGNYSSGSEGAAAFAFMPGQTASGASSGDVWINSTLSYNANPTMLGYGQQVLTHEIGHALGLGHPGDYDAGEDPVTYAAHAAYYEDSRQYTLMSYFNEANTGANFSGAYAAAPLLDDIAAIQRLYGANMTTRTGDTVYGFNSTAGREWYSAASGSSRVVFAVWDAGGTDTLDFSGYSQAQVIDLRQGAFSDVGALRGNVAIAVGAVIENAVGGSGGDRLTGNSGDNRLAGGAGADTLDGGLGADTVVLSGSRSAYTITEQATSYRISGPDGIEIVSNVETLQFADQTLSLAATAQLNVSGDVLDNLMTGGAGADTLNGAGGADTVDGGGGADRLDGGAGADRLQGGSGDDLISGGAGADTIDGGAGVDTLVLYDWAAPTAAGAGSTVNLATGVASGGLGADRISGIERLEGSPFADVLIGDAGANTISGGGDGDSIQGGDGADLLMAGTPGVGGGAPDVVKAQATANGATGSAVNLDGSFDALPRGDVSQLPSATVTATSHGGYEFYAFTAAAGAQIVLDIDGASFDSTLRLLNAAGEELAINDDSNPDNNERTDSQIVFTAPAAGTYYVQVGAWQSGSDETLQTQAPPAGGTYTLHVSVTGHAVVPLTQLGSTMEGGAGDDRLLGSDARDILFGGDGADSLSSGAGDDNLQGNKGADLLDGGFGADFVFGGQDDDGLTGGDGADWMNGNLGADTVDGGAGSDTMFGGQADDLMYGQGENDRLVGDLGDDVLFGGAGDDILEGAAGDDVLNGEAGADLMVGGAGNDVLRGGDGADLLTGSDGADLFVLEAGSAALAGGFAGDTVVDFGAGDRLSANGGAAVVFVGAGAAGDFAAALAAANASLGTGAANAAGVQVGGDVYVFIDGADADRAADMAVLLKNVTLGTLDSADFAVG